MKHKTNEKPLSRDTSSLFSKSLFATYPVPVRHRDRLIAIFMKVKRGTSDPRIIRGDSPLFQLGNGYAVFAFAKHAQTERFDRRMAAQMLLHGRAQSARSLAVDHRNLTLAV